MSLHPRNVKPLVFSVYFVCSHSHAGGVLENTDVKMRLHGDEIRVLVLEPTDEDLDDAFIQCILVATSIDTPVEYEALSYTWGDDTLSPTRCIDCDGDVVPVTVNLYEALLALRHPNKPRTLWIDALCIDQSNNEERNHQVALMARIYRKAVGVLIWLGNEGPAMDGARSFEYLRMLYELVQEKSMQSRRRLGVTAEEEILLGNIESAPGPHPSVESALNLFLRRRWFTRRWVLQEVYHAREARIYCGTQYMMWEHFVVGFLRLYSADHRYRLPMPIFNIPHADRSLILDHLDVFDQHDCHDPRDKIFSLLSLDERASYLPDYALGVSEVFLSFAQHSTEEDGAGLQVLAQASWQSLEARTSSDLGLPSWVPDWRSSVRDPRMLDSHVHSTGSHRFSTQWKEELVLVENASTHNRAHDGPNTWNLPHEIATYNTASVQLFASKRKLVVNAYTIGIVKLAKPTTNLPETQGRFENLNVGHLKVQSSVPLQSSVSQDESLVARMGISAGQTYTGYHGGSIKPGDTVCLVKDSTLMIALRPGTDQDGEWQLVRWCVVHRFVAREELLVSYCIV